MSNSFALMKICCGAMLKWAKYPTSFMLSLMRQRAPKWRGNSQNALATRDDCENNYFCNAGMYSDRIAYLQQELDHMDAPGFVQKSAPVDTDGFGLVANAGIPGHNKETYPALTIEICKSICVQRPWCKSIDFDRTNGACYVQPVAEEDVGALRTDYPGHPYDHYFYAPRLRN